eukprot:34408-Alexandrium_andersonii.AAC.1
MLCTLCPPKVESKTDPQKKKKKQAGEMNEEFNMDVNTEVQDNDPKQKKKRQRGKRGKKHSTE